MMYYGFYCSTWWVTVHLVSVVTVTAAGIAVNMLKFFRYGTACRVLHGHRHCTGTTVGGPRVTGALLPCCGSDTGIRGPRFRVLRASMFVVMGCTGIVPMIHMQFHNENPVRGSRRCAWRVCVLVLVLG